MKTFVADTYQVSLYDDGSFEVHIIRHFSLDVLVTYSPKNKEEPWAIDCMAKVRTKSIGGLGLDIKDLKLLHEALKVIDKQDLMDSEITFMSEKQEPRKSTVMYINGKGENIEFEGTVEQIEAFEDKRKEINESLFPRGLSLIDILSLALDYGLSVKSINKY